MIDARSVDAMTAAEVLRGLPSRLHQVYEPHLAALPDRIAFADTDRTWTYRQFADAVDAVAREFRDLGLRAGDRVMIVSENSTALGACVYAASQIDAWPCVTDPRLSAREVDLIAAHSDARRLIFMTGVSSEAAAHAKRRGAEPQVLGPFSGVAVTGLNVAAKPEPTHEDRARQVAALIYTSGTTGTPKGVMLSHENLLFTAKTTLLIRDLSRPSSDVPSRATTRSSRSFSSCRERRQRSTTSPPSPRRCSRHTSGQAGSSPSTRSPPAQAERS